MNNFYLTGDHIQEHYTYTKEAKIVEGGNGAKTKGNINRNNSCDGRKSLEMLYNDKQISLNHTSH